MFKHLTSVQKDNRIQVHRVNKFAPSMLSLQAGIINRQMCTIQIPIDGFSPVVGEQHCDTCNFSSNFSCHTIHKIKLLHSTVSLNRFIEIKRCHEIRCANENGVKSGVCTFYETCYIEASPTVKIPVK